MSNITAFFSFTDCNGKAYCFNIPYFRSFSGQSIVPLCIQLLDAQRDGTISNFEVSLVEPTSKTIEAFTDLNHYCRYVLGTQ